MILALSFAFGLGVLATVLAHEYERRKALAVPASYSGITWTAGYLIDEGTGIEHVFGNVNRTLTVSPMFSNGSGKRITLEPK